MRRQTLLALTMILLTFPVVFILAGCSEKDVPVYSNEDYILDYLGHSSNAKELFRVDGFFASTPYTVPFDSAVVTDRYLRRERTIFFDISDKPVDHGHLGFVKDAMVRVEDVFYIEVTRAYSQDTLIDTVSTFLRRDGFFMQLGEDTRLYSGWILWSMGGVNVGSAVVNSSTGVTFAAPVEMVVLTEMNRITPGSRLHLTTSWVGDSTTTGHLICDNSQSGPFTSSLKRYYDTKNYDSLSYQTPTANPRLYNLIMVQTITKASFPGRGAAYVIPYKAE